MDNGSRELQRVIETVGAGGRPEESGETTAPRAEPGPPAPPERRAAYADAFAASVATRAYAAGLAERGVALVVLPGAEAPVVESMSAQVAAAGGTVTATYTVQDLLVDPAEKSLVDTLGSQLVQQLSESEVGADATAYDRIGELLGTAAATTEKAGAPPGPDASAIVESLAGAGLVLASGETQTRAPLVLVVLGGDTGPDTDPIVEGVLAGLARAARGVVVAGDAASAGDGALSRLRSSTTATAVTTVDGIDGPAGQATAVLALVRSLTTTGGAFGAAGADGPVPLG